MHSLVLEEISKIGYIRYGKVFMKIGPRFWKIQRSKTDLVSCLEKTPLVTYDHFYSSIEGHAELLKYNCEMFSGNIILNITCI